MTPSRAEVWLFDLGMAEKVRPALVVSVAYGDVDRALITIIPHTTSLRGSQYPGETVDLDLRIFDTFSISVANGSGKDGLRRNAEEECPPFGFRSHQDATVANHIERVRNLVIGDDFMLQLGLERVRPSGQPGKQEMTIGVRRHRWSGGSAAAQVVRLIIWYVVEVKLDVRHRVTGQQVDYIATQGECLAQAR